MRPIFCGTVIAFLAWGSAYAADLAPAPSYRARPEIDWSGLYVGANAGWNSAGVAGSQAIFLTGSGVPAASSASATSSNGALAGLQVGINWQIQNVVYGFEGDFDGFFNRNSNSTGACLEAIPACTFNTTDRLRYFATLRARLGYAVDRWLLYITGGAVWQNVGTDISFAAIGIPSTAVGTVWNTPAGGVFGAGIEWAMGQNWSARVEYLHLQSVGSQTSVAVSAASQTAFAGIFSTTTTVAENATVRSNLVRVGLNYRFW